MASRLNVIWVRNGTPLGILAQASGGICLDSIFRITFFRVYLTPNKMMPDFRRKLLAFVDAVFGTE